MYDTHNLPTIQELTEAISYKLEAFQSTCYDIDIDYLDIRLRVTLNTWEVLSGDPQYDTNHTGLWAYSELDKNQPLNDMVTLTNIAADMLMNIE